MINKCPYRLVWTVSGLTADWVANRVVVEVDVCVVVAVVTSVLVVVIVLQRNIS